jgi:hypothetical protein
VIAGGFDNAVTAFTSVEARKFASPCFRQARALWSRFSASSCSGVEGTKLSKERVITRADPFHSASTSTSLRTRPLISLLDMGDRRQKSKVKNQKSKVSQHNENGILVAAPV